MWESGDDGHNSLCSGIGSDTFCWNVPTLPPLTSSTLPSPSVSVAATLSAEGLVTSGGTPRPITSLLSVPEASKQTKVWVGDGLPTVPKKLYDRTLQWEFIDLSELRPVGPLESIKKDQETQSYIIGPGFKVAKVRNKQNEDISTWLQCFSAYMAVLAKKYPETIGDMMAYMITVMRAQIEFEEPAWRTYDESYRDKAATTGNRKWSAIDPYLYNKIFTGRAKKVAICSSCGNTGHTIAGCKRKRSAWESSKGEDVKCRSPKIYWDYNSGSECQYGDNCRFQHRCSECGEQHPVIHCPERK